MNLEVFTKTLQNRKERKKTVTLMQSPSSPAFMQVSNRICWHL